jgi:hypothetical protein
MVSLVPSGIVLGLAALAAIGLATRRWSPPEKLEARQDAARVLLLAIGAQTIHFLEEWATGFDTGLGELLGLPPMPRPFFVAFNLAWLGVWAISVPGVRSGRAPSYFAAWFLAIAGTVNGVAHPALALASGSYFPGLASSPLIGATGAWLWWRLHRATEAGSYSSATNRNSR